MNKKQLEIQLSKLQTSATRDIKLEQYQIEGNLAAEILLIAKEDIENKIVGDFGCGSGILGIGALMLGAKKVYFIDIGERVIELVKENSKDFKNTEFYNCDISEFSKKVDTVIMNPPFGVQKRNADKKFLATAFKTADNIYSIHKIESSKFMEVIAKENNFRILNVIPLRFLIKRTYDFHKKKNYYVDVGLWILKRIK